MSDFSLYFHFNPDWSLLERVREREREGVKEREREMEREREKERERGEREHPLVSELVSTHFKIQVTHLLKKKIYVHELNKCMIATKYAL